MAADNYTATTTRVHTPLRTVGNITVNVTSQPSVSWSDVTNITLTNVTTPPSTDISGGSAGGVVALFIGLLVLGGAVFVFIIYLKRTGRLYRMIPFRPLGRPRRTSTSGSERALDVELNNDQDHPRDDHEDLPRPRDADMFTIDDFENVEIDSQSRGTNDEYFYDEVFGKSQFEDEATNTSMRQLYLDAAEDDEMDVDAIINHITRGQPQEKT